jgi:tRNA modification GTPase
VKALPIFWVGLFHWEKIILKIEYTEDTIAAIATPLSVGAIAIIRLSGTDSLRILAGIFRNYKNTQSFTPGKVYLGRIVEKDNELDEVLIFVFKKPFSYTKEDMVEIQCHGGPLIAKKILELTLNQGARLAEPGEFTKRAFLNGRLDLSQAEAVADLIQAKTEADLKASFIQLKGILHEKIDSIRKQLIDCFSLLELELDFTDENVEFVERTELVTQLAIIKDELQSLIDTYVKGRIIRDGIKFVIIGKPNVGKSSLLNALLKEDRAIVTSIPGTTRDTLEEELNIKGTLFIAVDTAGLTATTDYVEQQGINRTYKQIDLADIIVLVFDGTTELTSEDFSLFHNVLKKIYENKSKLILVINKIDLGKIINIDTLNQNKLTAPIIETSAKELRGIRDLEDALYKTAFQGQEQIQSSTDLIITKVRHFEALKNSVSDIEKAISAIEMGVSSEFVTLDLRSALDHLGVIIGTVTSEDILNNIFEKFCIGK